LLADVDDAVATPGCRAVCLAAVAVDRVAVIALFRRRGEPTGNAVATDRTALQAGGAPATGAVRASEHTIVIRAGVERAGCGGNDGEGGDQRGAGQAGVHSLPAASAVRALVHGADRPGVCAGVERRPGRRIDGECGDGAVGGQ